MVICLEQGADLHMSQLMPLPLTVSCFIKIQIGFTFLVLAHPGGPRKRAVKHLSLSLSLLVRCHGTETVFGATEKNSLVFCLSECAGHYEQESTAEKFAPLIYSNS